MKRVIVVHAPGDERQLGELLEQVFTGAGVDVRLVVQEHPHGPLEALACAAPFLGPGQMWLLLADTLVEDLAVLPADAVGVGPVDDAGEFCIAHCDSQGWIQEYADKPEQCGPSQRAVVGVYRFADAALVQDLMCDPATWVTGELSDLLTRYGQQRPLLAVEVSGWQDLGSYERYVAANGAGLTGRVGHGFEVAEDGSVAKTGERSHVAAQTQWYRDLPASAVGLALRLLEAGEGWYRVEFFDYPTLAQLLLYEPLPARTWRFVLRRLLEIVEERLWAPTRCADPELPSWCERKYITKTEQRLTNWPRWSVLRSQSLVVNEGVVPSFDELWPGAVAALRKLSACRRRTAVSSMAI